MWARRLAPVPTRKAAPPPRQRAPVRAPQHGTPQSLRRRSPETTPSLFARPKKQETRLAAAPSLSASSSPKSSEPPRRGRRSRPDSAASRARSVEVGGMFASRPAVHPVEAPPATDPAEQPTGVLMKDLPGMPGTPGSLALRLTQFLFAGIGLAVMASTHDFPSVSSFCYLVGVTILQCLWSFSLAILDIYALLVKRCLRNRRAVCLFTIGDGITATLTLSAACASAGITVLIDNDLDLCSENHCARFESAVSMAFLSWIALAPCFLLNFWSVASRRY